MSISRSESARLIADAITDALEDLWLNDDKGLIPREEIDKVYEAIGKACRIPDLQIKKFNYRILKYQIRNRLLDHRLWKVIP